MATTAPQLEAQQSPVAAGHSTLLICLPSATAEEARSLQQSLSPLFPAQAVSVVHGDELFTTGSNASPNASYASNTFQQDRWALTAHDYAAAARFATEQNTTATLLLGAEATSLSEHAIQALAGPVLSGEAELVLPRFQLGANDALVSSALLYPFTKALFGVSAHLPVPPDAALSLRFANRIASATSANNSSHGQGASLFWPVAEAAAASFRTTEVEAGHRILPQPPDRDLKSLLSEVTASLFTDLEAKANFWQRARPPLPSDLTPPAAHAAPQAVAAGEVASLVEGFRSAYDNLQEIWSLVLPPQSLFRVKRLSRTPADEFIFPPDLWARTAYDFLLAYHQRTINRGHLLGAMTPLYLAWVASHIRQSAGDAALSAQHVEISAAAFVAEKPYLVSQWRWPDRFNP